MSVNREKSVTDDQDDVHVKSSEQGEGREGEVTTSYI